MSCMAIGASFKYQVSDRCEVLEGKQICGETEDMRKLFEEINEKYLERLRKLDTFNDVVEVRVRLLGMWVTDLLEQNASLIDTVHRLECLAIERVLLLEEKLRVCVSSGQQHVMETQDPNFTRGTWVEAADMGRQLNEMQLQLKSVSSSNNTLQQELDHTRRVVAEKMDMVQAVLDRLHQSEQRCKDIQAALTAEVADKQDRVVQLMHQVRQLEEECRQADRHISFQHNIIKAFMENEGCHQSKVYVNARVGPQPGNNVPNCTAITRRRFGSVPSSVQNPYSKDTSHVDVNVHVEMHRSNVPVLPAEPPIVD